MNDPDPVKEAREWERPYLGDKGHRPPPSAGQAWLRFFLWIAPALLAILIFLLIVDDGFVFSPFPFWASIVITTIGCGIFDARIRDIGSGGRHPNRIFWVIVFCLAQVFLIPFTWLICLFGYCSIPGNFY